MKRVNIKIFLGISIITTVWLMIGCSDLLQEQPRSSFTPNFFQTNQGVIGGVTSLYADLRTVYGSGYYYNTGETGTDEYTFAQSADQNFKVMDVSGHGKITPTNSRSDRLWNISFQAINTASGIIENGSSAGVDSSLVAEARFFRAFYYFQLVQTFGGVPLDLGAGDLKFNTKPVAVSKRNTVPEVYTKAVFPDLKIAVRNLPVQPRKTGTATKTVARLYLAKAYLTYAWWLQNPRNIPTYPKVPSPRKDPDGHDAQWYFQHAYDVATTAIDNPGPYGLMPTFYDLHNAENDRNKEELLYADHTQEDEFYNGASLTYSSCSDEDNCAGWMTQWNYTVLQSSSSPTDWTPVQSVQREATQSLGRPWIRMAPTIGAIKNTFTHKNYDSRFDGTFVLTYRANLKASGLEGPVYNANFLPIKNGDPVLTFLKKDPQTPIKYPKGTGHSNAGAGMLPGESSFVIAPDGISRIVYPGLWKLGEYRTDNDGGLGQPNAASTRPFVIAYFSQLYFIAAEAVVEGRTVGGVTTNAGQSPRDLINVVRARAGKWVYSNSEGSAKVKDYSAKLKALTPQKITIPYILAERSREYFGSGKRWLDLVRTQMWKKVASTYKIGGSEYGDHTPKTVTRNIQKYLYLRPIPQSQIDALQEDAKAKAAYQNPGY